jgi:hypothetical protein
MKVMLLCGVDTNINVLLDYSVDIDIKMLPASSVDNIKHNSPSDHLLVFKFFFLMA